MSLGASPARSRAAAIAASGAAPVASGFVMWCASERAPQPRSVHTTLSRAASALRSRTSIPAPSPSVSPRRRASKGRAPFGSSAPSALKPLTITRQSESAAPQSTASTTPSSSHVAATASALAPLEHALESERARANGPSSFTRRSVGALNGWLNILDSAASRRGSAGPPRRASVDRSVARIDSVSNIPAVVPPSTRPTRRERTSSFASAMASRAASSASSLVRDTDGSDGIARSTTSATTLDRTSPGSKRDSSRRPRSPRAIRSNVVRAVPPSAVTAPTPVTTIVTSSSSVR